MLTSAAVRPPDHPRQRDAATQRHSDTATPVRTIKHVTSKDQLLYLVEQLTEEQADELLKHATERYGVPDQRRPLPAFVGIGDSGRSDISERVDDLLADGFGRP